MSSGKAWRKVAVEAAGEMVGSAFYVWVACAAFAGGSQTAASAIASGFCATALSYACGAVMNPFLSIVMCAAGRTPPVQAVANVLAQFVGAVSAAGLAELGSLDVRGNALPLGADWKASLASEAVATAMVAFAYMGAGADSAPIVLGMGTAAASVTTSAASSSVLNPFRAIAPALVSGTWGRGFWTFVVGPALGAVCGGGAHMILDLAREKDDAHPDPTDMDAALRRYRDAEINFA